MFFLYVELFVIFSKLIELLKNAVYALNVEAQYEILFHLRCVVFCFQSYCHISLLPFFKCKIGVINI